MRILKWLVICACNLLVVEESEAKRIFVPTNQPTIQAGINSSVSGDSVIVENGHYFERVRFNGKAILLGSRFVLDQDTLHIVGTMIDANDTGSAITCGNGEGPNSRIVGLTLQNGRGAVLDSPDPRWGGGEGGGGLLCDGSSPTISYCIVRDCWFSGIAAEHGGEPTILHCQLPNNSILGIGSGVITIDYCPFISSAGAFAVGSLHVSHSTVGIAYTQLSSNATLSLSDCTLGSLQLSASTSSWSNTAIRCSIQSVSLLDGYLNATACSILDSAFATAFTGQSVLNLKRCTVARLGVGLGSIATADSTVISSLAADNVGEFKFVRSTILGPIQVNYLYLDSCIVDVPSSYSSAIVPPTVATLHVRSSNIFGYNYSAFPQGASFSAVDTSGIQYLNPRFCDQPHGDYSLASNSPCLPPNNAWSTQMGAMGIGCATRSIGVHVSTAGNDSVATGSPSNPFASIQAGINRAQDGDSVIVSAGIYSIGATIQARSNLVLVAPDGPDQTSVSSGTTRCLIILKSEDMVVSGFSFTGVSDSCGGAILIDSGSVSFLDSRITGSRGHLMGGGIFSIGAFLTLLNCTISGNTVMPRGNYQPCYGGGIYATGRVSIDNCSISQNQASSYAYPPGTWMNYGGGLYVSGSGSVLSNSTISSNSAGYTDGFGGGAVIQGDSITISGCVFDHNSISAGDKYASSASGGGLNFSGNAGSITGNTFSSNSASVGASQPATTATASGGGLNLNGEGNLIYANTFRANSAQATSSPNFSSGGEAAALGGGCSASGRNSIRGNNFLGNKCTSDVHNAQNATKSSTAQGAGLYSSGPSQIVNNTAVLNVSTANLETSAMFGNYTALAEGGGIFLTAADSVLRNLTAFDTVAASCVNSGDSANSSAIFRCAGAKSGPTGGSCNLYFANSGSSEWCVDGASNTMNADPAFCDLIALNVKVGSNSPCAPGNNLCNAMIGANPVGCSCCLGKRGNVNCSTVGLAPYIDLGDLSALVSYLTGGGFQLCCVDGANVNGLGAIDLGDLTALISYLTGGGFVLVNCP